MMIRISKDSAQNWGLSLRRKVGWTRFSIARCCADEPRWSWLVTLRHGEQTVTSFKMAGWIFGHVIQRDKIGKRIEDLVKRLAVPLLLLCWLGGSGYAEAAFDGSPCPAGKTVIMGSAGNDIIIGTASANCISGLAGNDRLYGGGGKDWIDGGPGKDKLTGASSADVFFVDCGTITEPASHSTYDTITNYRLAQGDIVQVPGTPTNWNLAPNEGTPDDPDDKVLRYDTPGCPGKVGIAVLDGHSSLAKSSVDVR